MKTIPFRQQETEEAGFEITNIERLDSAKVFIHCALSFLEQFDKEVLCDLSTFEWIESLKKTLETVDKDLNMILADQKKLHQREPWEHSNG